MIPEALPPPTTRTPPGSRAGTAGGGAAAAGGAGERWGAPRSAAVLLTGVSYMIPFVAAGGLLIALGFLLGGYEIVERPDYGEHGPSSCSTTRSSTCPTQRSGSPTHCHGGLARPTSAPCFFTIGGPAFGFLVPALAGYIAYAIADRPGIVPGFVDRRRSRRRPSAASAFLGGFLGGIIGGVLAGVVAHWISRWKVPAWVRGLMPVVVIPLLATLISSGLMIVVLGKPLGWLMTGSATG